MPPTLIVNGWHVATVQFSRAVREGVACATPARWPATGRGLSKLNSMHPVPSAELRIGRGPGSVDVLGHTVGSWAWSSARVPKEACGAGQRRAVWAPVLVLPRKEVIQPHLPVRLPCYDFTPVTSPTFDGSLPQGVRPPASGVAHSRGVTGGVYKARERIHHGNADP